ncbi:MAG: thymidylate synthase [Planctomycetota bacterium]|nr:thymidylate synthase [Planctomycetota bacterium]MDI6788295.1 thymidylate synthase [Planctomycetota bacterium]
MSTADNKLTPVFIDAFNLDDAWFQALTKIIDHGYIYTITRGSFAGQRRLEFDFAFIHIRQPSHRPIIPLMPEGSEIPPPTSMDYVQEYMNYLLSGDKKEGEDYTYGERLVSPKVKVTSTNSTAGSFENIVREMPITVNQIEEVINIYKKEGFGTNQAVMEIGMPSDIKLADPPCLRIIDTRVRYGKLHFVIYFRSWDLWAGFPSNLAALQLLKEYMAQEIGVEDGEIVAASKGLHLYEYCWQYAQSRTHKTAPRLTRNKL